jgi:hypothetical protein
MLRAVTGPVLVAIALRICVGCSTPPTAAEERARLQANLRAVRAADGIDKSEAEVIAANYFLRFTPTACGYVAPAVDGGTVWLAMTYLGVTSTPTREPIRIHKQTGRITWSDGPPVENPMSIW